MGVGIAALKIMPLVASIAVLGKAILGLGATILATPIGWIIGLVAAFAAAAYLVYDNWEPISQWLTGVWESWKWAAGELWDGVTGAFSRAGEAISAIVKTVWDGIFSYFDNIASRIENVFTSLIDAIKGMWNGLKDWIAGIVKSIEGMIPESVLSFVGSVGDIAGSIGGIASGVAGGIADTASDIASGVGGALSSGWSSLKGVFGGGSVESNLGPPAGAQEAMRQEFIHRNESTRDAHVTVDFKNVPDGAIVKPEGSVETSVEKRQPAFMYVGQRMRGY